MAAKYSSVKQPCECGELSERYYGNIATIFVDYNIGKYDRQLGCVVESSNHRRKIMADRGLEAIDKGFDVHSYADKRKRENKAQKEAVFASKITNRLQEKRTIKVS